MKYFEEKRLSVTDDIKGKSGLKTIRVFDIIFIMTQGKMLKVHTADQEFYTTGTFKYWTELFNNSGFVFRVVDRNTAINVDRIHEMDHGLTTAHFNGGKKCNMSRDKYNILMEEFPILTTFGVGKKAAKLF